MYARRKEKLALSSTHSWLLTREEINKHVLTIIISRLPSPPLTHLQLSANIGVGIHLDKATDDDLTYTLRGKKAVSFTSNGLLGINLKGRLLTDKQFNPVSLLCSLFSLPLYYYLQFLAFPAFYYSTSNLLYCALNSLFPTFKPQLVILAEEANWSSRIRLEHT